MIKFPKQRVTNKVYMWKLMNPNCNLTLIFNLNNYSIFILFSFILFYFHSFFFPREYFIAIFIYIYVLSSLHLVFCVVFFPERLYIFCFKQIIWSKIFDYGSQVFKILIFIRWIVCIYFLVHKYLKSRFQLYPSFSLQFLI